jgi:hypothetical protein
MKAPWRSLGLVAAALSGVGGLSPAASQSRPPGDLTTTLGGTFATWRFSTAAPQDSLQVTRVAQAAIPLSAAFTAGRWTFDAGFAVATGKVKLATGETLDLNGVTDVRLRAVGHLIQDRLLVVLGVNAPTGRTKLTGGEIDAIRVLGAPALKMPVTSLGIGPAGTAGLVYATRAGEWSIGVGASFEARGTYAPIESRIAGVALPTDLHPGNTVRGSLGLDRLFGSARLSLLLATEAYSRDRIEIAAPGGGTVSTSYRLGPQLLANAMLELGVSGFRTFTITAADRYRTAFSGPTGAKVDGSSGNALEVGVQGITGVAGRTGFLFRVDGWMDGGLEVDNTITTAAMNGIGVTLGLSVPAGRAAFQPFIRGQVGKLDTGPVSTTATGFGAGVKLVFDR